jgi:hypothetical protein
VTALRSHHPRTSLSGSSRKFRGCQPVATSRRPDSVLHRHSREGGNPVPVFWTPTVFVVALCFSEKGGEAVLLLGGRAGCRVSVVGSGRRYAAPPHAQRREAAVGCKRVPRLREAECLGFTRLARSTAAQRCRSPQKQHSLAPPVESAECSVGVSLARVRVAPSPPNRSNGLCSARVGA